jgi:hypothetical protein
MGRRGYPPEFRRKVLDLVEAGRPIAEVAKALGISAQSIYTWRRQDRIDNGLTPGLSSPRSKNWRRRAVGSRSWRPSWRSRAGPPSCSRSKRPRSTVRGHPGDGRPRVPRPGLLSGAGWSRSPASTPGAAGHPRPGRSATPGSPTPSTRSMPPPARPKGSRRVHAELTLGRGISVGDHAVELPVTPRRPAGRHRPPQVPPRAAARGHRRRPGQAAVRSRRR